MILNDNETEILSFALCEYQELVDRVKRIKRTLVDAVNAPGTDKEKLDKIRNELFCEYGIVEGIDRAVTDGMTYLESEPMCELIDNVKKSYSGMGDLPSVIELSFGKMMLFCKNSMQFLAHIAGLSIKCYIFSERECRGAGMAPATACRRRQLCH